MNTLGYGVSRISAEGSDAAVVHWDQDPSNVTAISKLAPDAPKEITTLQPDFSADGQNGPVYDRDYVVDLLEHLTKDAKLSGTEILAELQNWGQAAK